MTDVGAQPGLIYGTVLVLSVIVGEARVYPDRPGQMAAVVAVTAVIFWLAHVYAHGLGESVARHERLSLAELRDVARREVSIVEAAVLPVAALALGALGVLGTRTGIWLAFGLGLAVLVEQGFAFARAERLGRGGTLLAVGVNLGLGLALVALKLLVAH